MARTCRKYLFFFKFWQFWALNPRPTKPFFFFFCNMVYQGGGYHSLMNLKLTAPMYDCLVQLYRVGIPVSIDTKIMKIDPRMTSHWRFQTWPEWKSGFSVKKRPKLKKINFIAKKVPVFVLFFCLGVCVIIIFFNWKVVNIFFSFCSVERVNLHV